jgi:hypothetical protein
METSTIRVSECVGCGYCCMKTQCDVSYRLYKTVDVCPQLRWDEQKEQYVCGLMLIPGLLGEGYRKELHSGAGCCSNMNDWRKDVKKRSRGAITYNYPPIPAMFQAFLKAVGSEPFLGGDTVSLILGNYKIELQKLKYSEEEIEYIIGNVIHYIKSNKSSMFKGFMA